MLTLPPSFEHPQWAERWNASVREAAEAAEVKQVRRCGGGAASAGLADARRLQLPLASLPSHPPSQPTNLPPTPALHCSQALQLCINVYPSLRSLASLADWALLACLGGGRLSAKALRAAAERQLDQAKGMVRG